MSVIPTDDAVISAGQPISLLQLVQVTASASNPAYLVLNGFDRNEYTAAATETTGSFSGLGGSIGFNFADGDAREAGLVFQYQAATGRYYSAALGYLDQLTYAPSTSQGDITDLSFFSTNSARVASIYASNALALTQIDAAGYLGTVTVATEPGFAGPIPAQATPQRIAALADSFVGQSWNMNGCWVLASTIAAEAGASLPLQSTADMAGQANGEWFVAYNGPAGSYGNWQSMVRAGDMVGFVTGSGSGHITTCVSGAGSTALLVDNVTYVDGSGNILNAAGDGSASDVTVEAPHAAAEEWAGVEASSVVIYRLDTPIVTVSTGNLQLAAGASQNLGIVFSAADPAGRSVSGYQAFLADPTDSLAVNGAVVDAISAATAATVASLSQLTLDAGPGGTGMVSVRAFNGAYWGDWTSLAIDASSDSVPPASFGPIIATSGTSAPGTVPITPGTVDIHRFFDTTDGTHFFTASPGEADGLIATRSDMTYEGIGLGGVGSPATDPAAQPVYRFFSTLDGTHFYTASASERDTLVATQPDLKLEGTAFYEDQSQQPGDSPVYRFFDTRHGTHLYTESASERATILSTRPDLTPEGIAFYAPQAS